MGDEPGYGDVEYDEENQQVKLTLRRPIFFKVPTQFLEDNYNPKRRIKKPSSSLEIDWVYGYRGRDCRNNVILLGNGDVVYFIAAVGIVYNVESHSQKHYAGHNDDIKSIAVHSDGVMVATGQTCGRDSVTNAAHVRIWSSETMETLHVFGGGDISRCVNALAFSKEDDGAVLAVVDDAPEPKMSLWNWEDGKKLTESKVSADPILSVTYSNESPSRIITSGKNHMAFWLRENGNGRLARRTGIFGSHEKPKYVTAVAFSPDYQEPITGDSSGNLLIWKSGGNTVTSSVDGAHSGAVFCIHLTEDNNLISGGKDLRIVEYDQTLKPTGRETSIPEMFGAPRQIVLSDETLIVGTTKNAIVKGTFDGNFEAISQGHLEELWGVATHPTESKFATVGRDGMLFVRNTDSHNVEWSKDMEHSCQSAAYSPGGEVIVVGATSGKWMVINTSDQEIIFEGQDGDEAHQMIKFSPKGSKVALGSRDNNVYIYDIHENYASYTKHGTCEGHSSFITHFDWSEDGTALQTNSGDYEHLFWNIENDCDRMDGDDAKDLRWATNSCLLSFYTLGVWPEGVDGTDVNSSNKANGHDLIATGDDFGCVKLFKYPASYQHMKWAEYKGHSSHVTTVLFTNDDRFVVSTGGRDTSTIQWKVTSEDEPAEDEED